MDRAGTGPAQVNRILKSLIASDLRVRYAIAGSDDLEIVRSLIEAVFVKEKRFVRSKTDSWDEVAHFYLLTCNGEPAGCLRLVDPVAFENRLRFSGPGAARLPIEETFQLSPWVERVHDWFEPSRLVIYPAFRRTPAFLTLLATVYLYAVKNCKTGAVCLANPHLASPMKTFGWDPMGPPLGPERYGAPAHPMMCRTEQVAERYKRLFLAIEANGLLDVEQNGHHPHPH